MARDLLIEGSISLNQLSPSPFGVLTMNRLLTCMLLALGVTLLAAPAEAQVYYSTYYAPTVAAPTTLYYPSANRVTSYYAPTTTVLPSTAYTTTPVTSYYAPSTYSTSTALPVTSYYAPTTTYSSYYAPATTYSSYYAPTATPVTTYYAPTTAVAPVYYTTPAAVTRATTYYAGQPVRNVLRALTP
jgi:hypothetical protein